jgi:hypothetical protein
MDNHLKEFKEGRALIYYHYCTNHKEFKFAHPTKNQQMGEVNKVVGITCQKKFISVV